MGGFDRAPCLSVAVAARRSGRENALCQRYFVYYSDRTVLAVWFNLLDYSMSEHSVSSGAEAKKLLA